MSEPDPSPVGGADHVQPEPDRDRRRDSVLEVVSRITGHAPKVLLQDEDSPGGAPIDPAAQAKLELSKDQGKYQLLGEIARGGMGVVLKGHDGDLGRDVAVKILHQDLCQRPEILQRFVEEAQIGGQLQHPGIVPVYELGLMADDRPYFTMKLIKGRTLRSLLDERQEGAAGLRRFLSVFEDVCQTMAYAHSRSVIHRDLKPSNVMVGAFGEVQVVDWGLGKVLPRGGSAEEASAPVDPISNISIIETVRNRPGSSSSDSMSGSVMGTPAYMCPEQAQGMVEILDERADVFSLGAILCEILTGEPPYRGSRAEQVMKAGRAELDDAFTALDSCGADAGLVTLCKRCLDADRMRRPRQAGEVATKVHEWLESVEDRAREARIKAVSERKARRLTLALAGTVVVAMAAGAGGWSWLREQERVRLRESTATVQRELAEAHRLLGEAIAADPGDPVGWDAAQTAADRAAALVESIEVDADTRDEVATIVDTVQKERRLAAFRASDAEDDRAMRQRFEEIRALEGSGETVSLEDLDALYARAFEDCGVDVTDPQEAAGVIRDSSLAVELSSMLDGWAAMLRRMEGDDSEPANELLQIACAADPDITRQNLRRAVLARDVEALRKMSRSADTQDYEVRTLTILAAALRDLGAAEDAVHLLERVREQHPDDLSVNLGLVAALRRLRDGRPVDVLRYATGARALDPDSVEAMNAEATALFELGQYERAAAAWSEAVERRPDVALLRANLCEALVELGRGAEAVEHGTEAVNLAPDEARNHRSLGRAFLASGDVEAARQKLEEATLLAPSDARAWAWLGEACLKDGDAGTAIEALREAMALDPANRSFGEQLGLALTRSIRRFAGTSQLAIYREAVRLRPDDLDLLTQFAPLLEAEKLWAEAAEVQQRIVELRPEDANELLQLGFYRSRSGDREASVAAYEKSMRIDPTRSRTWNNLGAQYEKDGDFARTVEYFARAVELDPEDPLPRTNLAKHTWREEALPVLERLFETDPEDPDFLGWMAEARVREQRFDEAVPLLEKAIRLADSEEKEARFRMSLGAVRTQLGDPQAALAAIEEGLARDPENVSLHEWQAWLLQGKGELVEARAEYEEMLRLQPDHTHGRVALGNLLIQMGEQEAGLDELRVAAESRRSCVHALNALAAALRGAGLLEESLEAYRQLRTEYPSAVRSQIHQVELARALELTGRSGEAVAAYQEYLAGEPPLRLEPVALRGLAWILATSEDPALRDPEQAVRLAWRARGENFEDPLARRTLGVAFYAAGNAGEARGALEPLAEEGDPFASYYLALACHALGDEAEAKRWFELPGDPQGDTAEAWEAAGPWETEALEKLRAQVAGALGR